MRYPLILRILKPNRAKLLMLLDLEKRWHTTIQAGVAAIQSIPAGSAAEKKRAAYQVAQQPDWLSVYAGAISLAAFSLAKSAEPVEAGPIKLPPDTFRIVWPTLDHPRWSLRLRRLDWDADGIWLSLHVRRSLARRLDRLSDDQRAQFDQRAAELHHCGTRWWLQLPPTDL